MNNEEFVLFNVIPRNCIILTAFLSLTNLGFIGVTLDLSTCHTISGLAYIPSIFLNLVLHNFVADFYAKPSAIFSTFISVFIRYFQAVSVSMVRL